MADAAPAPTSQRFSVDCSSPVTDDLFTLHAVVEYLLAKMKLGGLKNNLANKITIQEDPHDKRIDIVANVKYAKRAVRYYCRRFLKKQGLRERLRVIATSKTAYEFRPYRVSTDE
jgi:large subunit ribosomal protein L22e